MKKGSNKGGKKVALTSSQKLALEINHLPNKFQSLLLSSFTNRKNFNAFTKSPLQRPLDQANICTLMRSFKEYGTGATNITIIKTSAFGIKDQLIVGDGQHNIEAAKLMGLGLNGRIVMLVDDTDENVLKFIAILNNARKGWSNQIYTDNYGKLKDESISKPYQTFTHLLKTTKLTITDLSYIFLGGGSKKEVEMFKRGELQFLDEKGSTRLLNAVLKVKDSLPNKSFARRSLYRVMRMTKNYDKFADKIIESNVKFSENENELYTQLVTIHKLNPVKA